jgi:hypothetical protein
MKKKTIFYGGREWVGNCPVSEGVVDFLTILQRSRTNEEYLRDWEELNTRLSKTLTKEEYSKFSDIIEGAGKYLKEVIDEKIRGSTKH